MEVCTDFPRLFPWSDPVISSACSASVPLQPLHGPYGKCYHKRRMMMIFLCCDANWYTNMQWMTKTPIAESRTPIMDVCADHITFFRTTKTCRAGPAHELFSWWMYNSLRVCLFPLVIKWGHETGWWYEPFENTRSFCLLKLKKREEEEEEGTCRLFLWPGGQNLCCNHPFSVIITLIVFTFYLEVELSMFIPRENLRLWSLSF